jgi:ankyrin repeat protein
MRINLQFRPRWSGARMTMAVASVALLLVNVRPVAAAAATAELADAAELRDAAGIRTLLDKRLDVNAPQGDGMTALHWAVRWDDVELAQLLLRAGADANRATELGVTPLWMASQRGNPRMISPLLAAGARATAALATGETVLMRAAWTGNAEVVKELLAHGAAVNVPGTPRGQTALMWAISQRHSEVARLLIEQGADIQARSTTGFTPLMFAAREGDVESARVLLEKGANANDAVPTPERSKGAEPKKSNRGETPRKLAYNNSVTLCLTYDPICTPIAGGDGSALLIAAVRGHTDVVKLLLEHGADPNADGGMGYTALHWAAGIWGTELVGPYAIAQGHVAEWDATAGLVGEKKLEMVKLLLKYGADPNARLEKHPPRIGRTKERFWGINREGATPLFLAAQAGNAPVMRLLLAAGADPHLKTEENARVLMAAASMGRVPDENPVPESEVLEAVKLAFSLGEDANAVTVLGDAALHAAAVNRLDSVVQFLVDNGADVNARNLNGQTPLTLAELTRQFAGISTVREETSTGTLLRKLGGGN